MTSFGEREFDATRDAAVAAVVLDPVINDTPTRLVGHVPHVHAALGVAHVQALVIPTSSSSSVSLPTTTLSIPLAQQPTLGYYLLCRVGMECRSHQVELLLITFRQAPKGKEIPSLKTM